MFNANSSRNKKKNTLSNTEMGQWHVYLYNTPEVHMQQFYGMI